MRCVIAVRPTASAVPAVHEAALGVRAIGLLLVLFIFSGAPLKRTTRTFHSSFCFWWCDIFWMSGSAAAHRIMP